MLLSGKDYLESIRDGRVVYLGKEKVTDVTTHPAFKNSAATMAMIYDRKRAPENQDYMVSEEEGEIFSTYYLRPRSKKDLERRFETHRKIASWTYGLVGRSPDNFPSYLSGLATRPELFNELHAGFGDNLTQIYKRCRRDDLFLSHTVTNPQVARRGEFDGNDRVSPTLKVISEDDDGVIINGLKMIGTAAIFCHETWVGNLQPVPEGHEDETITCSVPLNSPGVSIWSRKPYETAANSEFDMPLSWRYDESDAAVLFENVKVPWENVVLHNNVANTRSVYFETPGHSLANHQANVRYLEKLKLLVAIAHVITKSNKVDAIPAVQTTLGHLAAQLASLEGMIMGQIHSCEEMVANSGYFTVNRRYMYAALHWCTTNYSKLCDTVRELLGGGPFQMPADSSLLQDSELSQKFETYWSTPDQTAKDRMKLLRLAWDMLGSEMAGRHAQYEKFYSGPGFIMNLYSFQMCPWQELDGIVSDIMDKYDAV